MTRLSEGQRFASSPNPRRLHIFLAEKSLEVELVEVGQDDMTLAPSSKER